jgi:hypothetical protein
MDTLRTVLSIVASVAGALLTVVLAEAFAEMSGQGRTGIGAVLGGLTEALLSFRFWAVAAILFLLFFGASRLSSKPLRILLFWTPAVSISALIVCLTVLYVYASIYAKHLAGM